MDGNRTEPPHIISRVDPSNDGLVRILDFIARLEDHHIHYRLSHYNGCHANAPDLDSIMVEIAVPGQRWEVEFLANGDVQVEKFHSEGTLVGESELDVLFTQFGD